MTSKKARLERRRVLLAQTSLSTGGIGSYALGLSAGLQDLGWDVHLMVTNEPGDRYAVASRGFACHDLSENAISVAKVWAAAKVILDLAPEVVILNHTSLINYALPLLPREVRPVSVVHSDDARFYRTAAFMARRMFRWVAPTPRLATKLRDFVDESAFGRIRVIPHGIEEGGVIARVARPPDAQPVVTFVGYVAQNKGADLLPEIFARIKRVVPTARLTVAGSGPLTHSLDQTMQRLGLAGDCNFLGTIDPSRVQELLTESSVLLLPSRVEGFGLVIAEAMMAGAVPVVTRLKGITDTIVADGVTGLLVELQDLEGYAKAVATLLTDPERLSLMRFAAMDAARERFSRTRMASTYHQMFSEPDDRPISARRNVGGWMMETGTQLLAGAGPGGESGIAAVTKVAGRVLGDLLASRPKGPTD